MHSAVSLYRLFQLNVSHFLSYATNSFDYARNRPFWLIIIVHSILHAIKTQRSQVTELVMPPIQVVSVPL